MSINANTKKDSISVSVSIPTDLTIIPTDELATSIQSELDKDLDEETSLAALIDELSDKRSESDE